MAVHNNSLCKACRGFSAIAELLVIFADVRLWTSRCLVDVFMFTRCKDSLLKRSSRYRLRCIVWEFSQFNVM